MCASWTSSSISTKCTELLTNCWLEEKWQKHRKAASSIKSKCLKLMIDVIKFIYFTHKIYQMLFSLLFSWWLFLKIDGLFSSFLLLEENLKPSSTSFSFLIFSMFIPSALNVTLLFSEARSLPTGVVLQFAILSSSF